MTRDHGVHPSQRWLAAMGALCAGLSVAAAAYASHGLEGEAQSRMMLAAMFAFGHGVALAVLGRQALRGAALIALALLLFGVLVFSGSLAGAALAGWPTRAAPWGGMSMMLGWLLLAVDALRR
ncbi:DUF423 domain-containing protein [Luteimonas sp. MHLX1A]|uniref:DUF423 domain-containing protein n=1 Tax=Alterluteimonas muca TaxID=2878684 RepID=UPI001E44A937|nr:DUF423 domain-containing protein [Luteimonas sp. MHLX1A]MCD9046101.1 DUF423 domain-containing protein [Luteimonas sp. MHLX1A]